MSLDGPADRVGAIKELLPRAAGISLYLDGDFSGKSFAGLGVDPISLASAPFRECARVDINTFDGLAFSLKFLLGLLQRFDELVPGSRQVIGVFEDGEEGFIIFLPAPRKTDGN